MKLATLPICIVLTGAYPLPRKDEKEVPPREERVNNTEPVPPPKPDEIIIKIAKESKFFGQTQWCNRDKSPEAFYTRLYRPNGAHKRRPKRR